MDHIPGLQVKVYDELQPGACVAFSFRGETHIGIIIPPIQERGESGVLSLFPGHPDLGGWPCVFSKQLAQQNPIILIPDAKAVLPTACNQIRLGQNDMDRPPLGTAVLHGRRTGIIAAIGTRGESRVFNLGDGTSMAVEFYECALFSTWEIAIQSATGELQTICRVEAGNPTA